MPDDGPVGVPPPSIGSAVARFVAGSLVAVAVVTVGGYFALRNITIQDAERGTRQLVQIDGRLVQSALSDGLLKRDPAAIAKVDDAVVSQVLPELPSKDVPVVNRVKIWAKDGTVLYSDAPQLIGKKYQLGAEEKELLEKGGAEAELSDLSKPENQYERQYGQLLEAHTNIRTPNGTPVLFEIYQQFDAVKTGANDRLKSLAPPLLAGLLVLLLFQVPLAWQMGRRLQRGHRDREILLANAIEASDQERRRIASDLHDGAVQHLAGTSFSLAGAAERTDDPNARKLLHDAASSMRRAVRELRSLLVELHPPNLRGAGLEAALSDLLARANSNGAVTNLHVQPNLGLSVQQESLVFRTAQEAVRNVASHAEASRVDVTLAAYNGGYELRVSDDGAGFEQGARVERRAKGHLGLQLLEERAQDLGARVTVRSKPGEGTTLVLRGPST